MDPCVRLAPRRSRIILVDLIFNACLGLVFSLCARDRLRTDGPFATPAFVLVLSFIGLVLTPGALYLYLAHPAWTWMYMVDPAEMPSLAILPMMVLHGGAVVGGFYGGARMLRADRRRALLYTLAGGAALLGLLTLLLRHRLFSYGSYGDWVDGRALDLMDVKLGYVLAALVPGTLAAAGFVALELFRDSRRVRAR